MGFPLQSLPPLHRAAPLSRPYLLSCRLPVTASGDAIANHDFRALLPAEEPFSPPVRLTPTGAVPLLGFPSLRLSPSRPCYPFGSTPLSHFTTTDNRSRRRTLCLRVFLTRGRMDLREIPCLLDVSCLARFPLCSSPRRSRVYFFNRVECRSSLNVALSTLGHHRGDC
jgi:hypothetical protein